MTPDYTEYFKTFKRNNEYLFGCLEEVETKGDLASLKNQLIDEAKKDKLPKRAEKAIIRRIKRL